MRSQFKSALKKYFEPLCDRLNLKASPPVLASGYARSRATGGNCAVYCEYERGLLQLSISAVDDDRPVCNVDQIATRFPPVRSISGGLQRLSLAEQVHLIESRWNELQTMFSEEGLPETLRWRDALSD